MRLSLPKGASPSVRERVMPSAFSKVTVSERVMLCMRLSIL